MTALVVLAPHLVAVKSAQAVLDAHNRNGDACPLDGLLLAGRVIRHQQAALDAALHALRYADPCNSDLETLTIRGQHNRIAAHSTK